MVNDPRKCVFNHEKEKNPIKNAPVGHNIQFPQKSRFYGYDVIMTSFCCFAVYFLDKRDHNCLRKKLISNALQNITLI